MPPASFPTFPRRPRHPARIALIATSLVIAAGHVSRAQSSKPPLTWDVIDRTDWAPYAGDEPQISDDGKYIIYSDSGHAILRSTDGSYEKGFVRMPSFVPGTSLIINMHGDTLSVLRPDSASPVEEFTGVDHPDYEVRQSGNRGWLIFQKATDLWVVDVATGQETRYEHCARVLSTRHGQTLFYVEKASGGETLHRIDLVTHDDITMAQTGGHFDDLSQDPAERVVVAFAYADTTNAAPRRLMVFHVDDKRVQWFDDQSVHLESGYTIDREVPRLVGDGQFLVFSQTLAHPPAANRDSARHDSSQVALNIWNYKQPFLPKVGIPEIFEDGEETPPRTSFEVVLDLTTGRAVPLERPDQGALASTEQPEPGPGKATYALARVSLPRTNVSEHYIAHSPRYAIIDLATGAQRTIPTIDSGYAAPFPSPDGEHILFYTTTGSFYVYDVATGTQRRLTDPHTLPVLNRFDQRPSDWNYGVVAWLDGGKSVLVNGEYDIWKLDLTGHAAPTCVTRNEGARTQTMLRLVISGGRDLLSIDRFRETDTLIPDQLILLGQNFLTKTQGVYTFDLQGKETPRQLTSGPYVLFEQFNGVGTTLAEGGDHYIAKARNGSAYVFVRSDLQSGANVYFTKDFATVTPLTHRNPYAAYNWMTSELISWRGMDNRIDQGILFKPENFDPSKKYPVIVTYYEKNSARLDGPEPPERHMWTGFTRNIGYYVSNGYLVFVPDVYYKIGDIRQSVYLSIMPGVQALIKRPYVDAAHIGATGASWGGCQTAWLLTKSGKTFAAAFAEIGVYDMFYIFYHNMDFTVNGQVRMGTTPWDHPEVYVRNSAALFAPEIQTPLALMNNDQDGLAVSVYGIEMFLYLRELGKPAWLLEYAHQGHGVGRYFDHTEADVVDYRIRFQQFFDHFLRGAPEPKWMAQGVPPHLKGIDNGLELP